MYQPTTVFGAMWTQGVRNVAVVLPTAPSPPSALPDGWQGLAAHAWTRGLNKYDYIVPLGGDLQLPAGRVEATSVDYAADLVAEVCDVLSGRLKDS